MLTAEGSLGDLEMSAPADSGRPMPDVKTAMPRLRYVKFSSATRQVSLRNVGVNTLWMSFDKQKWHDVACGTSWDDRVSVSGFWYCTQVGKTRFVVIGVRLCTPEAEVLPTPTEEELS